eukprot:gb/GEZJ01000201.1/.p2 GENE.gb/GEZJ01000201.1/~~gb/GEZJ01000201.1/.p2  ORF type:complete len:186 (-),score=18.73 gb/GEZJ01000201.1/:522-1079(-)
MLIKGVPSTRAPERAPPRPLHLLSQSAISYLQPFFSLSQIHLITPLSFDMQPLSCSPTMSSSHTMSSSPPPRPSLSEHVIPASQYHAVVSRLDSEAELTHRLQSQLVDAQKHVEHLRIQLQSIRGTNNSNNSNNSNNKQQQQHNNHQLRRARRAVGGMWHTTAGAPDATSSRKRRSAPRQWRNTA